MMSFSQVGECLSRQGAHHMLVKNLRYEAGSAVHQPRPLHVHPVLPLVSPHSCVLRCVDGQRWGLRLHPGACFHSG